MDNLNAFDSFEEFFTAHPETHLDEILHLSELARYYKRLNGKTLDDICAITSYRQLCTVASELEINRYKTYKVSVLRSMMIEKYKLVFAKRNKLTNVPAVPTQLFCSNKQSINSNGAYSKEELVQLMLTYLPVPNNKKRKHMSKCLRREVWNRYIGEENGTHACFCCETSIMSQFLFEVGHVVSVHDNGDLSIDNLRPICGLCNRSMGTMNMLEFIKAQNLSGLKNFVK